MTDEKEFWFVEPADEPSDAEIIQLARERYRELCRLYPSTHQMTQEGFDEWAKPSVSVFANGFETSREILRLRRAKPLDTIPYEDAISEYGDIMTVGEWLDACMDGLLINYDGHGHPARDGMMSDFSIYPSIMHLVPKDATHIIWFNR